MNCAWIALLGAVFFGAVIFIIVIASKTSLKPHKSKKYSCQGDQCVEDVDGGYTSSDCDNDCGAKPPPLPASDPCKVENPVSAPCTKFSCKGDDGNCYVKNATQCAYDCSKHLDSSDASYKVNQRNDQYWWKNADVLIQAGGSGDCSDVTNYSIPALEWWHPATSATPVQDGMVQIGADYIQKWTWIDGGTDNLPQSSSFVMAPNNNVRSVAVAYPKTSPPVGGFPYVFAFEFMDTAGKAVGWNVQMMGGIAETTLSGGIIPNTWISGELAYLLLKRHIVKAGFALVMVSEYVYDTEFWVDCDNTSIDNTCWNGGKNVDADVMKVLFEKIRTNSLVEGVQFSYNRLAVMGYSTGAQMVSRIINNFPLMKTSSGANMPSVQGGILIGGGSYHCYEYTSPKPPKDFLPCAVPAMSCCPVNKTEDNYDNGTLKDHPPTLLLQGENDAFAAWEASLNYFAILSARGTPCYRILGPITNESRKLGRHGAYICQIPGTIGFLLRYV